MPIVRLSTPADLERTFVPDIAGESAVLISISGQTGAGKSTILNKIADFLRGHRAAVAVIDEKSLHNPYLDRYFHDPERFGFEIQLRFMLDRVILVERWLSAGFSVVMERSHLEDPVFVRTLREMSYVTDVEFDLYMGLWTRLNERAKPPDALIFLDVTASVSLARLESREDQTASGHPIFPDHETQHRWIESWHKQYKRRFAEIAADRRYSSTVLRYTDGMAVDAIIQHISQRISLH
ncbi:deoxynucleoside kinase [Nocardia colli]|uniref:deoxynucleoside kinase n=1 Tax=Nocardia colli TaxID=2545717 RepID=UPI0035DFEE51